MRNKRLYAGEPHDFYFKLTIQYIIKKPEVLPQSNGLVTFWPKNEKEGSDWFWGLEFWTGWIACINIRDWNEGNDQCWVHPIRDLDNNGTHPNDNSW